jgi:two-component system, chemotaxis family, chemotaxis protein CheY
MTGIVDGDRMLEQSDVRAASQPDLAQPDLVQPDLAQPDLARADETPSSLPRLLVIDDDNLHRVIICRVAAKAGYLPAEAATYDEAARLVQDGRYDCITLDLLLGDHACIEMLQHIWMIGCTAPIVIISGCDDATCSDTEKVAASLKLNVWQSIPKPLDMAVLRESLERLKAAREGEQTAQISPA